MNRLIEFFKVDYKRGDMRLIKARKLHRCKKCRGDIWPSTEYYPQRRGKAICIDCGNSQTKLTFIGKLLKWLS